MRNGGKIFVIVSVWGVSTMFSSKAFASDVNDGGFNYDDYAAVLSSYADNTGMVNYKKLKANREKLDSFVESVSNLDNTAFEKWNDKDKIAFWLNAYNAFTLKAIIDNYPIKPSFLKSSFYPKNSIRQINGVWDKITFNIMGSDYTLEYIEHRILRRKFDEPKIHMAMVCAAMGCPALRNEPFAGEELAAQLDDQTHRFLGDSTKFKIDREKSIIYLSSILKWFGDDFINSYAPQQKIPDHSKKKSSVLNFIAGYLEESDKNYILKGNFKIKYFKYDWSLNEQAPGSKEVKQ